MATIAAERSRDEKRPNVGCESAFCPALSARHHPRPLSRSTRRDGILNPPAAPRLKGSVVSPVPHDQRGIIANNQRKMRSGYCSSRFEYAGISSRRVSSSLVSRTKHGMGNGFSTLIRLVEESGVTRLRYFGFRRGEDEVLCSGHFFC
ncbi:hypothetical protein R1flu_007749 [Riccia fluitans]|uniref:Uncharacterized protein n=1 Tax=Riccia fluitans TaxID=41844 RepID=A0ABD1Z009_9MARC